MTPERSWRCSRRAWRAGHTRRARAVKAVTFALFHAVLPPEVEVGDDLRFYHHALGVVVHPNTVIGDRVTLGHGVTIAVAGDGDGWVVIADDVHVGAGATLLSTGGRALVIGTGASIGTGALVVDDVAPDAVVRAPLGVEVTR